MDLFELSAVLGLDTKPYETGLDKARNLAGKAASAIGDIVLAIGDKLVDFGKDVVNTGMNFDYQMSAVQAVLGGTEGTEENLLKLREFALDQAKDSIFTAEQTAQAYYYMGMAGWKTEQMMAGLPGIMALAAASGEDLGSVSDIVTDSITAFGLSADDVSHYVDLLAQTVTNSNTDVAQLGNAFKYAAPLAGSYGLQVEDVALALGLMASQGIKGSQAGTTLRQVFQRLGTDTGDARTNLEKLGVQVFDSSGNMRDFGDIIDDSRKAFSKLNDEEKNNYAYSIAGQRGMSGWLAIMNATEQDVQKLKTAYDESAGAAQRMADTRLDNLKGDILDLQASLDILKIAIYDDVKSPFRDVVQYITGAIDRITEKVKTEGLMAGIEQLGIEIRNFGEEFKDEIAALVRAVLPIIESVGTEIMPAIVDFAVKVLTSVMSTLVREMWEGWKELFRKAEIAGHNIIVNLEVGFLEKYYGFKRTVSSVIEYIKDHFKTAWENAKTWGSNIIANIVNGVVEKWNAGVKFFSDIGTNIRNLFTGLVDKARQWGADMIQNFKNGIVDMWNSAVDKVRDFADKIRNMLHFSEPDEGPLSDFHTYAPDMMKLFAKGVTDNAHLVTDAIGNAFDVHPHIVAAYSGDYGVANTQPFTAERGQEYTVPRQEEPKVLNVIFKLADDTELGRAMYRLYNNEAQRVGVRLAGGVL